MNNKINGLNTKEVLARQVKYGKNELNYEEENTIGKIIIGALTEPVFILLIVCSFIYFILGKYSDGIVMLVFIIGILSVDIIQEWKTDKTLTALKKLSSPTIKVIRNGKEQVIPSSELVPDDIMLIYEGVKIPADGIVTEINALYVDESTLTGESEPVYKVFEEEKNDNTWKQNYVYAGTLVISGTATIKVINIGQQTEYGKIGKYVSNSKEEKAPLDKQVDHLIKICSYIAIILCFLITLITFINNYQLDLKTRTIDSIISGITVAMGLIPEEFPVILTVFLSMGAWRLAKKNSLVKKLSSVETLGSISVLCVDKTGTITQNKMKVETVKPYNQEIEVLAEVMGLCCEENTYDPMEKAMLNYCKGLDITKKHLLSGTKLKDYPFTNETKMMGKAWLHDDEYILAVKGSAENILELCKLTNLEKLKITHEIEHLSKDGLRVIAVAEKKYKQEKSIPDSIPNDLLLCGLVGLMDPPKDNIKEDIKRCNEAGIRVIMITGDNGITASSIAKSVGIPNSENVITGQELEKMSMKELQEKINVTSVFSRVIPEHKMRIVKAFKDNGEIVGMTGDGVNDAPALKYADIGIAMGLHGSDVSREAADLILLDDNFSTIVETIYDSRRIYDNIKKAFNYIITIHLPIALSSLLAPILGIHPEALLLLPTQIVLMELVIDPTSSIVFERQPAESNIMTRKPRNSQEHILNKNNLIKSTTQGFVMFAFSFLTYYYLLVHNASPIYARTIGLMIVLFGNIFLIQVNSSNNDYAFVSLKKLAKDKLFWGITLLMLLAYIIILYSPLVTFLNLTSLSIKELIAVIILAFISTYWYELIKFTKK